MIGRVIGGDFEVRSLLGEGGMGSVFVAIQNSTGKRRALKVMKPGLTTDSRSYARFVDEARVGSRIESDHVVQVIAAGIDEETRSPWLAMELLDGRELGDLLVERGPLPFAEVRRLFGQLAHALGAAHRAGIIHRDLKPENLFIAESRTVGGGSVLKILDFGIAAFISSGKTAATVTSAIGSPFWLAPEQANAGALLRPATDVWAMGLIAFYLLTGAIYWRAAHIEGAGVTALLAEILTLPMPPASHRSAELGAADVPDGFDAWFGRCTQRDPLARFSDATEAFEALSAIGSGPPRPSAFAQTQPRTSPTPPPPPPPSRRPPPPPSRAVAPTAELTPAPMPTAPRPPIAPTAELRSPPTTDEPRHSTAERAPRDAEADDTWTEGTWIFRAILLFFVVAAFLLLGGVLYAFKDPPARPSPVRAVPTFEPGR